MSITRASYEKRMAGMFIERYQTEGELHQQYLLETAGAVREGRIGRDSRSVVPQSLRPVAGRMVKRVGSWLVAMGLSLENYGTVMNGSLVGDAGRSGPNRRPLLSG